MAKKISTEFFDTLVINSVNVSVYLMNGIKLQGLIESFDDESIVLKGNSPQLIFIHAISSIVPNYK
ncbi:MAG: RNA chaperone Hfq [Methylophilaceae bacterium]|jgi:host factor-I protein|nr:RNA chaperone Hfq [Methylophilaceae bacterium]NCV27370.1 RNA chaperone Hfq [Nitrosomonadales bacterium]NCV38442.1 RNA chaperone Hfq [Betaproteobacteria bacterium]MDC0977228.1 RNA chaperone Hfq [Methylophilaceae bacterium]NCV53488.1 RNA chaperone Hfq [Betaproteobacteria bacterium]